MGIKHLLLFATVVFLVCANTYGQKKTRELSIGDTIPNLVVERLINQGSKKIVLKDLYKGGLLIIDFWATWCGPCIQEMKFMDSLKARYPAKFNALMVSHEDSTVINAFLSKKSSNDIQTSNLILATKDTILNALFPHKIIPHNVWIDRDGVIRAITSGKEVNTENIVNFEDGKLMKDQKVKADNFTFNGMNEFHIADTSFTYRSIITPFINVGTGGVYGGSAGINPYRFFQWNASITHLFFNAYSLYSASPGSWRDQLIEVHTRDSLKLFYPLGKLKHLLKGTAYKDFDEWGMENKFCYALTLPHRVPHAVFRDYMFADLERQFNIKAKIEERKISCMVVTSIKGKNSLPEVKNKHLKQEIRFKGKNKLSIRNAGISDVLNWIFYQYEQNLVPYPFVNQVDNKAGISFDADLDFSEEDTSEGIFPEMIYRQLNKYGFQFSKKIRPYPILVLYDNK